MSPALASTFLTTSATWEAQGVVNRLKSNPNLVCLTGLSRTSPGFSLPWIWILRIQRHLGKSPGNKFWLVGLVV